MARKHFDPHFRPHLKVPLIGRRTSETALLPPLPPLLLLLFLLCFAELCPASLTGESVESLEGADASETTRDPRVAETGEVRTASVFSRARDDGCFEGDVCGDGDGLELAETASPHVRTGRVLVYRSSLSRKASCCCCCCVSAVGVFFHMGDSQ